MHPLFLPPLMGLQEDYVEGLETDMSQELRRMMLNLESKRVRYLLRLYHRTRLSKIEKYAANIMEDNDMHSRLSKYVCLCVCVLCACVCEMRRGAMKH